MEKKSANMKAMKKGKKTLKMSSKGGTKKLPPALQKAMEAKKKKAGGKSTKKMSITAKKAKVVKHKKKGRV